FFSSRRRHTISYGDWSSDVCSSDLSAYPREIDFAQFASIAKEVGALFMVDMAHIAGLVAAEQHMNPVTFADFVTSTTHKTLRGRSEERRVGKEGRSRWWPGAYNEKW